MKGASVPASCCGDVSGPRGYPSGGMEAWERFLGERPIAVIATTDRAGVPHAVPIEVVVDDGKVYSWGKSTSTRAEYLRHRPLAAITAYKGHDFVMVRGSVELFEASAPDYPRLTGLFLDKYERTETYANDLVIELTPEEIVARIS